MREKDGEWEWEEEEEEEEDEEEEEEEDKRAIRVTRSGHNNAARQLLSVSSNIY